MAALCMGANNDKSESREQREELTGENRFKKKGRLRGRNQSVSQSRAVVLLSGSSYGL